MIGEEWRLRLVEEDDLPKLFTWRNTERIRKAMYTSHIISWEEHCAWFKRTTEERYTNRHYLFLHNKTPLGVVNFTDITKMHKRLTWGFYIGEEGAPKASGTIMGIRALDLAFNELEMHKVCGEVLMDNHQSVVYHEKMGFLHEGILKEHIFKEDKYVDVIVFGQLSTRWHQVRENLIASL